MVHQMYKTKENWSPSSLFRGDTYEKGFNSSPSKLLGNHFQVSKLGRSWKFSGKGSFSDGKTSARPDSRLTNERLKARHTYLVFGSSLDIFKMLFKISSRVLHIQLFPGIGSWILPFAKPTTEARSHFSRLSRKLWTSPFWCWGSCMAPANAGMLGFPVLFPFQTTLWSVHPHGFQRSISSGWSTMQLEMPGWYAYQEEIKTESNIICVYACNMYVLYVCMYIYI